LRAAIKRDDNSEILDLAGADLASTCLNGANLTNANLAGAKFIFTLLKNADLAGANLKGAQLWYSKLQGANLAHADLTQASFDGTPLNGLYLIFTNLTGADLTYKDLTESDLKGANLAGAYLQFAKLTKDHLLQIKLINAASSDPAIMSARKEQEKQKEFQRYQLLLSITEKLTFVDNSFPQELINQIAYDMRLEDPTPFPLRYYKRVNL
jgi:hypothetical protein